MPGDADPSKTAPAGLKSRSLVPLQPIEVTRKVQEFQPHKFSIAPMMDWTDRHCRRLHRTLSRRARLYTEMLTADAVIHGDAARLVGFHHGEDPVALGRR